MRCIIRSGLVAFLAMATVGVLVADEDAGSFSGSFDLGIRSVDVGGAERKYREDIDLDDGPRLFGLRFDFVPPAEKRELIDRLELDLQQLGGDPFESIDLRVRKYAAFDLRFDRKKSTYFYDDFVLPVALSNPNSSNAGDFHTFDVERVRDSAALEVELDRRTKLTLGFERFTRRGDSTTTLDIQRDEFELDQTIDESLDEYHAGVQFSWEKATLVLDERIRDYNNAVEIFLPGFSLGENPEDPATVDFFFLDQPYDYDSQQHVGHLLLEPNLRTNIRITAQLEELDLDLEAEESSQGTTFTGDDFTTQASGTGEIERDLEQYGVELDFAINHQLALVTSASRRQLDQTGDLLFGNEQNRGQWTIETDTLDVGLDWAVSQTLSLAFGVSQEEREAQFDVLQTDSGFADDEDETTERTGYFAILSWKPQPGCELTAEIEDDSFDDPFTASSATDRNRYRLRGAYRWKNGLSLSGAYQLRQDENDTSDWSNETESVNARLAYQRNNLLLSVGYSGIDVERSVDRLVVGGFITELFPIFYDATSDFLDLRIRWQANDRLVLGTDLRRYANSGSFALERDDLYGYARIRFVDGYAITAGYRTIDYDEDAANFDDYDADLLELSIGYSW